MSGYSVGLIRRLLSNYASLEEGKLPAKNSNYTEYWGPRMNGHHNTKSPFENAILMKADIDRAIQQLPPEQKFIIITVDIDERSIGDCAYWLGKEVSYVLFMEIRAVRRMVGILSGKTESRCRSLSKTRNPKIALT